MMNIFISYSIKGNRDKETTFAFVSYMYRSEMMKAIKAANNKRIDGWCIRVKEAAYGSKERRLGVYNQS
ncbi:hypothetical protein DITRI_Ditri02bG0130500 [Diplodiscus trichospermus]